MFGVPLPHSSLGKIDFNDGLRFQEAAKPTQNVETQKKRISGPDGGRTTEETRPDRQVSIIKGFKSSRML